MPDDFSKMQAQAIKYAREMQQKASPPRYSEQPRNERAPHSSQAFPSAKEIFGHRNPWSQARETPFCKGACPVKSILGTNNTSSGDNDLMLLMALLLVLSQDSGDKMLMLALLYIMT